MSNVERSLACCSVFAGPEDGAAPSLMLEYQKSRRRRTALGSACDVGFLTRRKS
jgi:hypothetical protein